MIPQTCNQNKIPASLPTRSISLVHIPDIFDVLRKWIVVLRAHRTAVDVGHVDDNADDDEQNKDDETEPKQDSLESIYAEVFENDNAQEETAKKSTSMCHVTNLRGRSEWTEWI